MPSDTKMVNARFRAQTIRRVEDLLEWGTQANKTSVLVAAVDILHMIASEVRRNPRIQIHLYDPQTGGSTRVHIPGITR